MSSLKIETPRVSLPVRTPAPQAPTPATASPGIVPPAAPRDGFETAHLPVAGSGGSVYSPSGASGTQPKAAAFASIGASGTKPHGGLSEAAYFQLDQDAIDIRAKMPDMSRDEISQAIKDAVGALHLETEPQIHEATRYLSEKVYDPGSGGSGDKHFRAPVHLGHSSHTRGMGAEETPPSEHLEQHRRTLTDLAYKLAGDANLKTDGHVRKAAWAEIKKLGLGDSDKQHARSLVLEQVSALRGR